MKLLYITILIFLLACSNSEEINIEQSEDVLLNSHFNNEDKLFNVVDFVALNQGSSGPNTAEIIVYDDQGKLVGTNRWNLATGVKATYIIYKN